MGIVILDNILHGQLKPWKANAIDPKRLIELLSVVKGISATTRKDLQQKIIIFLSDYPELQKTIVDEFDNTDGSLMPLLFNTKYPKYNSALSQFYYLLITTETLRFFNNILQKSQQWIEIVDLQYQIGKVLTNVKVLAIQTSIELKERGFTTTPNELSDHIHFALYYLKQGLMLLYFSLQESFKESLIQIKSQEDFHLLELEEPLSNFSNLEYIEPVVEKADNRNKKKGKFSFGFKGDQITLKSVISQLCLKLDLINESTNTADDLLQILTSKDFKPGSVKLNIACETVEFRYILSLLKFYFENLTYASVEESAIFYSKKGTLLTAQNLYSSKITAPKTKEEIDDIVKHLKEKKH